MPHGLEQFRLQDGGWGEAVYAWNKLNGKQVEWYPNGQLRLEREYRNDQQHETDRGWYPSVKPQ